MNERILELAKQIWSDPNISHTNHIKFAQLIVTECIVQPALIGPVLKLV